MSEFYQIPLWGFAEINNVPAYGGFCVVLVTNNVICSLNMYCKWVMHSNYLVCNYGVAIYYVLFYTNMVLPCIFS